MARLASAIAQIRAAMVRGDMEGEQEQFKRRESLADRLERESARRAAELQANRTREDNQAARREELSLRLAEMGENRALQEAFRRDQLGQSAALSREAQAAREAEAARQREWQASQNEANRQNARDLRAMVGGTQKPVPNAVAQGYMGNQQQLRTIDAAITALESNPDAVGAKGYLPDAILNRIPGRGMAGGVDARAGVADVGSLEIRDRSGAAVTASEFPRLKPFIPDIRDDATTALKKLRRMRDIIAEESQAMAEFYTPDQGYRGLPPMRASTPAAKPSPSAALAGRGRP